jgi:hypothetical protein
MPNPVLAGGEVGGQMPAGCCPVDRPVSCQLEPAISVVERNAFFLFFFYMTWAKTRCYYY